MPLYSDMMQWVFRASASAIAISKQTLSREQRARLSQIVGPSTPTCAGRRGPGGIQKNVWPVRSASDFSDPV
jgi:hypothetical protein